MYYLIHWHDLNVNSDAAMGGVAASELDVGYYDFLVDDGVASRRHWFGLVSWFIYGFINRHVIGSASIDILFDGLFRFKISALAGAYAGIATNRDDFFIDVV